MKKLIALTIALFVLATGNVFGQSVSDDISAQANIITAVTVTGNTDLSFGDVIAGTNGTIEIDNTNGSIVSSNSGTPVLGQFTLAGSAGEEYSLTFTIPANLSDGTNDLGFSMNGADYGRVEDSAAQDGNFNPSTGVSVGFDGTATDIVITLGGQVSPTAAQVGGLYTGTVTLEVTPTTI